MNELYKVHRPKLLKQIKGQRDTVQQLSALLKTGKLPQAILFSGPSGCGKTTIARILKTKLNCGDRDFTEVNCAEFNGIDKIREIRQRMALSPIDGDCRIWMLDEAHAMTTQAQNAALKTLEDTPRGVYFFLCTTEPDKVINTIRTRCMDVTLKALPPKALLEIVNDVAAKEGMELTDDVKDALVEYARGSARKVLVLMHSIANVASEESQLETIASSDSRKQAIALCRALLNPRVKWKEVATLIKGIEETPEAIRRMALGYAANVMLSGGKLTPRAYLIVEAFKENFFDSGRGGLVSACFDVVQNK